MKDVICTNADLLAAKKAEIETNKAELKALELAVVRDQILETCGEDEWVSSPSRSMVNIAPALGGGWEVTVFDYSVPQDTGKLTMEDLLGIRSYIDTILEKK